MAQCRLIAGRGVGLLFRLKGCEILSAAVVVVVLAPAAVAAVREKSMFAHYTTGYDGIPLLPRDTSPTYSAYTIKRDERSALLRAPFEFFLSAKRRRRARIYTYACVCVCVRGQILLLFFLRVQKFAEQISYRFYIRPPPAVSRLLRSPINGVKKISALSARYCGKHIPKNVCVCVVEPKVFF